MMFSTAMCSLASVSSPTPESAGVKGDHFVGGLYVKFDQELRREREAWLAREGIDLDKLKPHEKKDVDARFNAESELIERVHQAAQQRVRFILINPAAFTHTSVALRDALSGVDIPFIEIHLSNVHARETFREHSYFSDIAVGVISGLGAEGYELALQAALNRLATEDAE